MSRRIFYDETGFRFKGWRKAVKLFCKIIRNEKRVPGDLNFIVTTDSVLLDINLKFLKHSYFTDVITFNYNNDNVINGEIYISIDTVRENSLNYNVSLNIEVLRVFIHGVLHLLGYDDKTDSQKRRMKELEDFWLSEV